MKFSALNLDFSSLSTNTLRSKKPAYAGVKEEYPLKVVILPLLTRLACKRLQIGTYLLFIIKALVTSIDDLERL